MLHIYHEIKEEEKWRIINNREINQWDRYVVGNLIIILTKIRTLSVFLNPHVAALKDT